MTSLARGNEIRIPVSSTTVSSSLSSISRGSPTYTRKRKNKSGGPQYFKEIGRNRNHCHTTRDREKVSFCECAVYTCACVLLYAWVCLILVH